jgi:hypothetical protein
VMMRMMMMMMMIRMMMMMMMMMRRMIMIVIMMMMVMMMVMMTMHQKQYEFQSKTNAAYGNESKPYKIIENCTDVQHIKCSIPSEFPIQS